MVAHICIHATKNVFLTIYHVCFSVMVATLKEMEDAQVPLDKRDYCAHLYIKWKKCHHDNRPWAKPYCKHEAHEYAHCQHEE